MTKKFVFTVIILLCLIIAIGAYVYAVWLESYRQESDFNIDSEYYNESAKYFEYKLVYDEASANFAAVVINYTGLVTTAHIPTGVYVASIKEIDSEIPNEKVLPSDDEFLTVIGVETRAFIDNDVIKRIIISQTVIFIQENAFNNCENLEELSIVLSCNEHGVLDESQISLIIKDDAFISCDKLSKISFIKNDNSLSKIVVIDNVEEVPNLQAILSRFPTTVDYSNHPIAVNAFYGTPIYANAEYLREAICPKPEPVEP